MTNETDKLEIGSMVRVACDNSFLNGKLGTLLMNEADDGIVFGTCVLIEGAVYGFSQEEVFSADFEFDKILK